MNHAETARLLGFIQAIDNRVVDELTITAWQDLIGDVDYRDAYEAVRQHRRTKPDVYLTPGHVLAASKAARTKRLSESTPPAPPVLLPPDQDLAWRRSWLKSVGNGASERQAAEAACHQQNIPIAELDAPRASRPQIETTSKPA